MLGGKAARLAELSAAGVAVPPGMVVTAGALDEPDLDGQLQEAAARLGGDRFAVRSSGAAEHLADASYAGLYESYLNVSAEQLGAAVRRCFAAAASERVAAYQGRHGSMTGAMAVLVQVMVDAGGGRGGVHRAPGHRRPDPEGGDCCDGPGCSAGFR